MMFLEEYSDLNNCNIIKDLSAWFLVSGFWLASIDESVWSEHSPNIPRSGFIIFS